MLRTQPIESRESQIRELFAAYGGKAGVVEFAQICIDAGVWPDDELAKFTLHRAAAIVRKALKTNDASGLAFAGPTTERGEDGAPVWKQRMLWEPQDYAGVIGDLDTRIETMQTEREKYADECIERFGYLPAIKEPDSEAA